MTVVGLTCVDCLLSSPFQKKKKYHYIDVSVRVSQKDLSFSFIPFFLISRPRCTDVDDPGSTLEIV